MNPIETAIIGGSGFYQMTEISAARTLSVKTPFGDPSDQVLTGVFHGKSVAFLARHGRGHRLNPSEVNYRANVFALKSLGARRIVSVTAVGSLREDLPPSHLVIPDQYVDLTWKREKTYFEKGIVAHVSMADPTCPRLSRVAADCAADLGLPHRLGGTYVNMEGPQFSSRAESHSYRKMGYDIIGMTQAVEAKLAREMEMCFLPLAFVTDFDCWHAEEGPVNVDQVVRVLQQNIANSIRLIGAVLEHVDDSGCACEEALKNAIMTSPGSIPAEIRRKLDSVLSKYVE